MGYRTLAIIVGVLLAGATVWLIARDGDGDPQAPDRALATDEAAPRPSRPAPTSTPEADRRSAPDEPRPSGDEAAAPGGDEAAARSGPPRRQASPRRPAHRLALPDRPNPIVLVRRDAEVAIRSAPDGGVVRTVDRATRFGSVHGFSVVERRGPWAGVPSPYRDNDQLGWLRLDERRLRAAWTPYEIRVDLSRFRARLLRGDRAVRAFPVTIGAGDTPTPTGRFAVTDTFRGNLTPAYGCCAVAITARQPHLPSGWLGGDRIAFHGTAGALGVAASNGCVRARDADVDLLVDRVGVGTPVVIRP